MHKLLTTLAAVTALTAPALIHARTAPQAAQVEAKTVGAITITDEVINKTPVSVAVGLEDVNHEIYGGIYSQMIYGEAFAEPARDAGISGMWRATGAAPGVDYSLVTAAPFKGKQSQRIARAQAGAWTGLENRGLNRQGMSVERGKAYEGMIVLRSDRPVPVRVSLQSADGRTVYASQLIRPRGTWSKYPIALTPSQADAHARFAVEIAAAGSVELGYAFVQPGAWGRFKGLPVRADVAKAMVDQGLQAIRFGGCANGGCGDVSDYKWKTMIGDPADRPVTKGFWYPQESNGFGIFEFMQLGEALGIEAVPSLNIDETPQDIRDLMEYMYGPVTTTWGARRAADGHPAPYRQKRIQLGNEEAVDQVYYDKFKALAEVIWEYDPKIRLVVGDFTFENEITDPLSFRGGGKIKTLAAHRKLLMLAAKWDAEIDFDVHLWTRNINDGGWNRRDSDLRTQIAVLDSFAAQLRKFGPENAKWKVVVFELNANSHDLSRALANAYAITALQRRPYLDVVSSANALQVDGQNDNGWNQGLIFMNQGSVWKQPPYYVHQMIAASQRANVVRADVRGGEKEIEATAFKDARGLSLHLVNPTNDGMRYTIDFGAASANAAVRTMLLGHDRGTAVNTAGNPTNIVPEAGSLRLDGAGRVTYTIPPRSFVTMQAGR